MRCLHGEENEITFTVILKQMRPAMVVCTCIEIARPHRRRWKKRYTFPVDRWNPHEWTLTEGDLVNSLLSLYQQIPGTIVRQQPHDSRHEMNVHGNKPGPPRR